MESPALKAQPIGDVPANAQLDDLGIEAATSACWLIAMRRDL
jgi:hypothetical protein